MKITNITLNLITYLSLSLYSCPVSREQSTATNPPLLLPCGHVLCKGNNKNDGDCDNDDNNELIFAIY